MRLALAALTVAVLAGTAAAQECPQGLDPYRWQEGRELPAQAGERFFADLQRCDRDLAASVTEAVRQSIQVEETARFVRQRRYLIAAYGVLWAVVAAFAAATYLRQRRLKAAIADLEAALAAREEAARPLP
jgi:hypothetical protein